MTTKNDDSAVAGTALVPKREPRVITPLTDLLENDAGFELRLDLPGADPESVDVQFEKGVLSVRADASMPEHGETSVVYREFGLGRYERRFQVTSKVDADRIEASYRLGVLHLSVPKAEVDRRQIEVRLG